MIETTHLQLLLATWVGRHQARVIAYLIEENRVLKEQLGSSGKRLQFTNDQRRRLAAKGKPLGQKVLRRIATIVTPDTILAWHRKLIAAKWTYPRKRVRHRYRHAGRSRRGDHDEPGFGVDGTDRPESDGL